MRKKLTQAEEDAIEALALNEHAAQARQREFLRRFTERRKPRTHQTPITYLRASETKH